MLSVLGKNRGKGSLHFLKSLNKVLKTWSHEIK